MKLIESFFGPAIPQIDPTTAHSRLTSTPKPIVLDVREPDEYREGHVPGATLIPLGELTRRVNELPRDREIFCICHSGSRSSSATRHLLSVGYQAINLRGGMISWSRAHLPIKKGTGK